MQIGSVLIMDKNRSAIVIPHILNTLRPSWNCPHFVGNIFPISLYENILFCKVVTEIDSKVSN